MSTVTTITTWLVHYKFLSMTSWPLLHTEEPPPMYITSHRLNAEHSSGALPAIEGEEKHSRLHSVRQFLCHQDFCFSFSKNQLKIEDLVDANRQRS